MSKEIFMLYGPGLKSAIYFPENSQVENWTGTNPFKRFVKNLEAINLAAEQANINVLEKLIATSHGLNKILRFEGLEDFHKSKIRFALFQRVDYALACRIASERNSIPSLDIGALYEVAEKYGIDHKEISLFATNLLASDGQQSLRSRMRGYRHLY